MRRGYGGGCHGGRRDDGVRRGSFFFGGVRCKLGHSVGSDKRSRQLVAPKLLRSRRRAINSDLFGWSRCIAGGGASDV